MLYVLVHYIGTYVPTYLVQIPLKEDSRSTVAFKLTHFRRILILTTFGVRFRHLLTSFFGGISMLG